MEVLDSSLPTGLRRLARLAMSPAWLSLIVVSSTGLVVSISR